MASDLTWALLGFAVVTLFTPGPNNTMLMSSGLNFGFRRGLPHLWGVSLGFAVMVLAGPHSSLLPQPLQIVALVLGWCAVLAVPILVARKVWLRWS